MGNKRIRNRMIIILVVTLVGLALVFKPHDKEGKAKVTDPKEWAQVRRNLENNIHLGLDLRGGSHLVMQVQVDDVIKKLTQRNAESARTKLQQQNIPFTDIKTEGINQVVITVPDGSRNGDIVREIENDFGQGWSVSDRGTTLVASLDEGFANQLRDRATDQAKQIIENRVNAFGVTEPTIARQGGEGTYQILIQMPGVDDPERVKNTLNADSNLELRLKAKSTPNYDTKEQAETAMKSMPGGGDQYEVFPYRERTGDG